MIVSGSVDLKELIREHDPDWLISYNYRHIIDGETVSALHNRIINLHYSLLPWNRGAYSNLWSFLEDTPKGVTIHLIDEGIDTGDILVNKEIRFNEEDETLESSYLTLQEELRALLVSNWHGIRDFRIKPVRQPGGGSVHYVKEFEKIKHIFGDKGWGISIKELKKRYGDYKRSLARAS